MSNIVYTALFVDNPKKLMQEFPAVHSNAYYHHSTIQFRPKTLDGIELGRKHQLLIKGRITTDSVDALLVDNPKSTNKYPHITLSTADGVSPAKSNDAFERHPNLIQMFDKPITIETTEGFFDGNNARFA